jgi:hypothetical protein
VDHRPLSRFALAVASPPLPLFHFFHLFPLSNSTFVKPRDNDDDDDDDDDEALATSAPTLQPSVMTSAALTDRP